LNKARYNQIADKAVEHLTSQINKDLIHTIMQDQIEKLEAEIKQKRAELDALLQAKSSTCIVPLREFSVEEKCEAFNKLYTQAHNVYENTKNSGWWDEDEEHYAFESMMGILTRDRQEFWKYYNSLKTK
jgi:Rad3-related DNA helicase